MKTYSKFFLSLSILAMSGMGFALTSCEDDEEIAATFKASDRNFDLDYDGLTADGEQAMFKLNATSDWKVSQKDAWLSLSKEAGTRGSHNIFITAEENLTGEDRTGFIEIEMKGKIEQIAVSQSKKVNQLSVRPNTFSVNALGFTADGLNPTFNIETNCNWTITLPQGCNWIVLDKTSGHSGKAEVAMTVQMNSTGADRTAEIEVKADDLTAKVTVKQTGSAFTFALTSQILFEASDPAGLSVTTKVGCIEGWKVASKPEWLTIDPMQGAEGNTDVTLTAAVNTGDAREGNIVLTTDHNLSVTIPVGQKTDKLTPDSKAVGYAYFSDDFAWAVGGDDQVSHINGGAPYNARNLYSWDYQGNGFGDVKGEFDKRYIDLAPSNTTIYTMDGYLKFDRGNTQTAIQIKDPLAIPNGQYADVEVSFIAAKNGTDDISVTVVIEGEGAIVDGESATQSKALEPVNNSDKTIPWTWKEMKVTIKGATSTTKIIIGETHFINNGMKSVSGQHRWFMDNLKVTRIANIQ